MVTSPDRPDAALHQPIRRFCGSHQEIFKGLRELRRVPALAEALKDARATALATLALFEGNVASHHADEENELFVAVLRSAHGTEEEGEVEEFVSRLTAEHRRIERMWKALRPAMRAVVAGDAPEHADFARAVEELCRVYVNHACLEEESFLPLADRVLARNPNHLEALDLSLHMRHVQLPGLAYV